MEEQKRAGKTGSVSLRGGGEAESEPLNGTCGEWWGGSSFTQQRLSLPLPHHPTLVGVGVGDEFTPPRTAFLC